MKDIEEKLKLKKLDIDNIEIPEDLEGRLRNALYLVKSKDGKATHKFDWALKHNVVAIAILLVIIISGLNYDVFAFYGKKILGYDQISSGSIKELNELGRGQELNKSYKFKNGVEVILDGVMFDNNKTTIMYRILGESEDKIENLTISNMKGLFKTYSITSGHGIIGNDKKEIIGIQDFQPLSVFDRNLTFNISSNSNDISNGEEGHISFKINMDKAIKRVVNSNINKIIESQGVKYKFTTLSASKMSVLVNGTIQLADEKDRKLFTDMMNGVQRTLRVELLESYIKDGKVATEVIEGGMGSMGSDGNSIQFQYNFDGLKPNLKSLSLNVLSTDDMRIIDKEINVNKSTKNERVVQDTEELLVKEVKKEGANTVVTFIGQEDIIFDTALFIGDRQATELESKSKIIDNKGIKFLEKTYTFKGNAETMGLMFKTLSHRIIINKQIVIYKG